MLSDPLNLTWNTGANEGTAILDVNGPLTLNNLFSFQDEVVRVKPQLLILDLTHCPYIDSAGLGSLINTYVSAEKRGGKLFLCGVNNRVAALLETAKVHLLLKSFPHPASRRKEPLHQLTVPPACKTN